MKRVVKGLLIAFLGLYVPLCTWLYFNQERMIFFPTTLPPAYKFQFNQNFEEVWIEAADGVRLNGLIFKSDSSRGLIFYLHGNGGAIDSWGSIAPVYLDMGFDIFFLDYRGYGKSEGEIESEDQFLEDVRSAFDQLTSRYDEGKIIVLGYSIGSGPACWLASQRNPALLLLQAPYYSLLDMKNQQFPFIPDFVLKYRFETFKHLQKTRSPVLVIHGNADEVIDYDSSLRLRSLFKPSDQLITLENQGHNRMSDNPNYRRSLRQYLNTIFR